MLLNYFRLVSRHRQWTRPLLGLGSSHIARSANQERVRNTGSQWVLGSSAPGHLLLVLPVMDLLIFLMLQMTGLLQHQRRSWLLSIVFKLILQIFIFSNL